MFGISTIKPEEINGGINLIDIGASGKVPSYWEPIAHLVNLIGFDPNEEECTRLNHDQSEYLSQLFLPYAIAGEVATHTLYKTQSIYCWSLLKPNLPWLRRLTYSDLFEIQDTEEISTVRLDGVSELKELDIDAIKLDTQGLELPILKASESILDKCILVETETGFTDNYIGETTFDEIVKFMRSMGFELFDINTNHRVPRKNSLSDKSVNEQIIWCEALWLRDYCKPELREEVEITRDKALKALCIYANHGCIAFGLEAAKLFQELGVISFEEYSALADNVTSWELKSPNQTSGKKSILRMMLNYIPRRYFNSILKQLNQLRYTRHPLASILKRS